MGYGAWKDQVSIAPDDQSSLFWKKKIHPVAQSVSLLNAKEIINSTMGNLTYGKVR